MKTLQVVHARQGTLRADFEPVTARSLGVLGVRPAHSTECGVEAIACCNSTIATG